MEKNNEGQGLAVAAIVTTIVAIFLVLVIHAGINSCVDYVVDRAVHAYGLWIGLVSFSVGACGAGIGFRKLFLLPLMVGGVLMVYGASYTIGGKTILPFTWEGVVALEPVLDELFPDEFSGWDAPEDPDDYARWECRRY